MKRLVTIVVALLLGGLLTAPGAAAHTPFCGIWWGSLPKGSAVIDENPQGTLRNVRTGQHRCFDRVVLDVNGTITGYSVKYVDPARLEGLPPLRGGARLQIVAHLRLGPATYEPADPRELRDVSGYRTLRQVALEGAQSPVGVGVRARLPFRVFTLPGPGTGSRLVVDVAHRWF